MHHPLVALQAWRASPWSNLEFHRGGQEAERVRGKHGQELCCGFHDKEWARQGKLPGLAGLTNFSCLWAIGVVPSCLVLAWGG